MKYSHLKTATKFGTPVRKSKPRYHPRGDEHASSVLTEKLVRRIKSMYVPRRKGATHIQGELAKEGIHVKRPTIVNVLYGITWGHVK